MSTRALTGIHHITAIAGDPQRNLDFYTHVLGLRLVKLTLIFDDPGTYHFYFGRKIRFGESVIRWSDPDELPLELIGTTRADPARAWRSGPIPAVHALSGFHSATLSQDGYEKTAPLMQVMGLGHTVNEDELEAVRALLKAGDAALTR